MEVSENKHSHNKTYFAIILVLITVLSVKFGYRIFLLFFATSFYVTFLLFERLIIGNGGIKELIIEYPIFILIMSFYFLFFASTTIYISNTSGYLTVIGMYFMIYQFMKNSKGNEEKDEKVMKKVRVSVLLSCISLCMALSCYLVLKSIPVTTTHLGFIKAFINSLIFSSLIPILCSLGLLLIWEIKSERN